MIQIARRVSQIDSSAFREAMKKQMQLVNPVDLSVGIPEELTPPHIKAAGIRAIKENKTRYTPVNGLPALREAISEKLFRENQVHSTPESIIVVPGLTTGQFLVYAAMLDPGDEVIVFDPYFPPYVQLASLLEARVITIPTAPSFEPNPEAVKAAITDKTKLIIINSPNNPTGAVYSESTLRAIAKIAGQHDITIVSDEIYEYFTLTGQHFSIGSIYPNTLTLNGFSKGYAMTGWRCGYIAGPQEIIDAITEVAQYIVFSNPSITQYAALEALRHDRLNVTERYQKKRDYVVHSLREIGYYVAGADGAYYVFVKTPGDLTDLEFANRAAEKELIIVPGRAFSQMHGYFRISYGASMDTLERGMKLLNELSREIKG